MIVEWVVYACPKCGIQHDQGDDCQGMPGKRHKLTRVQRMPIRMPVAQCDCPYESERELAKEITQLRKRISELEDELESERVHSVELSEGWE